MELDSYTIETTISREISTKPARRSALFLFLLVFNFVIFGYFGIYKGYQQYREKQALREEMKEVKSNLETNLEIVEGLKPFVTDADERAYINRAVPDDDGVTLFLNELVRTVVSLGFSLDKVTFQESRDDNTGLLVRVHASGEQSNVPLLIEDLEDLIRLNRITDVRINSFVKKKTTAGDGVTVDMRLFVVEN